MRPIFQTAGKVQKWLNATILKAHSLTCAASSPRLNFLLPNVVWSPLCRQAITETSSFFCKMEPRHQTSSTSDSLAIRPQTAAAVASPAVQLPYTLSTWAGMVQFNGQPETRWWTVTKDEQEPQYPAEDVGRINLLGSVESFQNFVQHDWHSLESRAVGDAVAFCLTNSRSPDSRCIDGTAHEIDRFLKNIDSLRAPQVTVDALRRVALSRMRLSLEQCAGMVVAAFYNSDRRDDAVKLARQLVGVLSVSSMTVDLRWLENETSTKDSRLVEKIQAWVAKTENTMALSQPLAQLRDDDDELPSRADLVRLLLRVRRKAPRSRCLFIPGWLFEETGITPPKHHASVLRGDISNLKAKGAEKQGRRGYYYPEMEPAPDSLILSRTAFSALQRRVFGLYKYWKPEQKLRHDVDNLETAVLYPAVQILQRLDSGSGAGAVALTAYWFFKSQRYLQLKVVSDQDWSRFLGKGEGRELYQNTRAIQSTFEIELAALAGESTTFHKRSVDELLRLIDQTCLLMRQYVFIHGEGQKSNLVYSKDRSGGSGRGPVDQYNLLCDVLKELKNQAKEHGIEELPGPTYKFLAKDIMHWNNAWSEDAFYDDREHGWEAWIAKRGL